MTAARDLATYLTSARPTPPPGLIHEMKRLLLDYLGVALSGSRTDSGTIAGDVMVSMGGAPQATLVGRGEKLPAAHAAFANAIAEHSIEMDDVDDLALFHHGPPVVSAALAVAEWQGTSGLELLRAMLDGAEVMTRVSLGTNPRLRDRGFHTTPTAGSFGAATAAGRLLGLTTEQFVNALALAGAQASGLMEMYGPSMQKRFNPGPTARNGVIAAMLAKAGFTGTDLIFEGQRGFGNAFADGIDTKALLAGLGSDIPVAVEYKPYSAARPIHNGIDTALALRARGLQADQVASIVIYRHPDWAGYHSNRRPATYHEAQVSIEYSTAIALLEGSALPQQYSNDRLDRPDIVALMARTRVQPDPSLPKGVSCRTVATTHSGDLLMEQVDDAKGSAQNPMTDDELVDKFTWLATQAIPAERAEELRGLVFDADRLIDVRQLIALTSPGDRRAA